MKAKDHAKFKQIKARLADFLGNHAEDIQANRFIRVAGEFFHELDWVAKQLDVALKGEEAELEEATV